LPVHLSRIEVLVDVEDKSCPCCGGKANEFGRLLHWTWQAERLAAAVHA
jgi:hypothetical protein